MIQIDHLLAARLRISRANSSCASVGCRRSQAPLRLTWRLGGSNRPAARRSVSRLHGTFHVAQIAVDSALKRVPVKSEEGLALARERLERAYAWLEGQLAGKAWAAGTAFSLADCAAAPSLFYADWTHRISEAFPVLRAYRARLLARPSFDRAVDEARPFRPNFPLGAPDRD
jgi:glutathione S-transferase